LENKIFVMLGSVGLLLELTTRKSSRIRDPGKSKFRTKSGSYKTNI